MLEVDDLPLKWTTFLKNSPKHILFSNPSTPVARAGPVGRLVELQGDVAGDGRC